MFNQRCRDRRFIMWGILLILSCVAIQLASHHIGLDCQEDDQFPSEHSKYVPSSLADLRVNQVTVGEHVMLNVSWAINIDASNKYLKGTRIVAVLTDYLCKYNPPLAEANLNTSTQIWFHFLVETAEGLNTVQVANLPFPPLGADRLAYYKHSSVWITPVQTTSTPVSPHIITVFTPVKISAELTTSAPRNKEVSFIIIGVLGGFIMLSSCYIIYKNCRANGPKLLILKKYYEAPMTPVPILVVYPAKNSAFQQSVVALAEFLQWHGGCSVVIDIWQQEKLAELGPMRWLAEKANSASQVLIVTPQVESPDNCSLDHSFPESFIPAATHDLYPLILNMVASHTKNANELVKFWVVQLGVQQDKRSCLLPLELRACKTFYLMKDLNKLCKSLHAHKQHYKILDLILQPGFSYSENSSLKLRKAIKKLQRHQLSISKGVQPLNSVVTTI